MSQKPLRRSSWSDAELQFLRERGPDLTPKEIAAELGKREATVISRMRRLELSWRRVKRTENRDADIQALWNTKTPLQIAETLAIPKRSIYSAAKRLGLVITTPDRPPALFRKAQEASSKVQRKKSLAKAVEKFGQWTAASAYVFGVLWADGYIVDGGVGLTVQKKDREWHAMIGCWLEPKIRITERSLKLGDKSYPSVTWTWGCVEGRRMLERMGLLRRKSFIDPPYPPIPDKFFSHFARGFQDGDGSPTATSLRWYGSPQFMEGFREQALRVWHPIKPNRLLEHGSLRLMQWAAKVDREQIIAQLYNEAGIWYLPRKMKHAQSHVLDTNPVELTWPQSVEQSN